MADHQHFDSEDQSGDGCLEDTGYGRRSSTAHEHHECLPIQSESLSQVAANGRASEHDGRLGSHTSTESDGECRRDDRAPAVMPLQLALLLADGIKNTGDAMADVISHHESHEQRREEDAHHGEHQIKPVVGAEIESRCEHQLDLMDEPVKHEGGHGGQQSHEEAEQEHELLVGHVWFSPFVQPLKEAWMSFGIGVLHNRCGVGSRQILIYFLTTITSPSDLSLMMPDGVWGFFSCRREVHT